MVSDCRWVVLPVGDGHAVFSQLPLLGPGRKAAVGSTTNPLPGQNPVKGKTRFQTLHSHRPGALVGPAINGPLGAPVIWVRCYPAVSIPTLFGFGGKHRHGLTRLTPDQSSSGKEAIQFLSRLLSRKGRFLNTVTGGG